MASSGSSTLPPPPLPPAPGTRSNTTTRDTGCALPSSFLLKSPQEVLASFVDFVPTFYVSLPAVAAIISEEVREEFQGRGKLLAFFRRYPFFFDLHTDAVASRVDVRLRTDVSHPRRGAADEKFAMTDVGETIQYIAKPEYIVSMEPLDAGSATGSVPLHPPMAPPAVRVCLEERVPVLDRLRALIPEHEFTPIEELEELLPEDVLFHPYFDCQGGLMAIASKFPDHFQVVKGRIRLRPPELAPLALDSLRLEESTLPDVAALIMEEVCRETIPRWVPLTPLYERLTLAQRREIKKQFKSFAGFLRAHGKSVSISTDMLQVAKWIPPRSSPGSNIDLRSTTASSRSSRTREGRPEPSSTKKGTPSDTPASPRSHSTSGSTAVGDDGAASCTATSSSTEDTTNMTSTTASTTSSSVLQDATTSTLVEETNEASPATTTTVTREDHHNSPHTSSSSPVQKTKSIPTAAAASKVETATISNEAEKKDGVSTGSSETSTSTLSSTTTPPLTFAELTRPHQRVQPGQRVYTRTQVLNLLFDRFPPDRVLSPREVYALLPPDVHPTSLPKRLIPWLASFPNYFILEENGTPVVGLGAFGEEGMAPSRQKSKELSGIEEHSSDVPCLRRSSSRPPLDLALVLYKQFPTRTIVHEVHPTVEEFHCKKEVLATSSSSSSSSPSLSNSTFSMAVSSSSQDEAHDAEAEKAASSFSARTTTPASTEGPSLASSRTITLTMTATTATFDELLSTMSTAQRHVIQQMGVETIVRLLPNWLQLLPSKEEAMRVEEAAIEAACQAQLQQTPKERGGEGEAQVAEENDGREKRDDTSWSTTTTSTSVDGTTPPSSSYSDKTSPFTDEEMDATAMEKDAERPKGTPATRSPAGSSTPTTLSGEVGSSSSSSLSRVQTTASEATGTAWVMRRQTIAALETALRGECSKKEKKAAAGGGSGSGSTSSGASSSSASYRSPWKEEDNDSTWERQGKEHRRWNSSGAGGDDGGRGSRRSGASAVAEDEEDPERWLRQFSSIRALSEKTTHERHRGHRGKHHHHRHHRDGDASSSSSSQGQHTTSFSSSPRKVRSPDQPYRPHNHHPRSHSSSLSSDPQS